METNTKVILKITNVRVKELNIELMVVYIAEVLVIIYLMDMEKKNSKMVTYMMVILLMDKKMEMESILQ